MAVKFPAPRVNTQRFSDAIHRVASITGLGADLDLTAVSGKPKCGARVTLIGGAATADAVMTTEKGDALTVSVPLNTVVEIRFPIIALVKSGSGAVQALIEWYPGDSCDWNL